MLSSEPQRGRTTSVAVRRVGRSRPSDTYDEVVTEEPLEIRVCHTDSSGTERQDSISVTMRTPGNDFELAAGFLFAEGVVGSAEDIQTISYCVDREQQYNIVNVYLDRSVQFDPSRLSRHFYTTSSCGVCGKASLEALRSAGCRPLPAGGLRVEPDVVVGLPDELRKSQAVFNKTGGLHASGLFDPLGRAQLIREDVGRHNALDKLIGNRLLAGGVPIDHAVCCVSGRIGFELVQKALVAGIPMIAGVGAPSSLAVALSKEFNMTLVGFIRDGGFNVYAGAERIRAQDSSR